MAITGNLSNGNHRARLAEQVTDRGERPRPHSEWNTEQPPAPRGLDDDDPAAVCV